MLFWLGPVKSASREYTLTGINFYQEIICLLNHDTKGCDTTKKKFILWFLLCKFSAPYLAGEVPHCCFSFSSSQVCETQHLRFMIAWSTDHLKLGEIIPRVWTRVRVRVEDRVRLRVGFRVGDRVRLRVGFRVGFRVEDLVTLRWEINEWFASNRIPCYAQRTLGSPGGKHCQSPEGTVWRKAVSTSKKGDFGERSTLFRRSFIAGGLREC